MFKITFTNARRRRRRAPRPYSRCNASTAAWPGGVEGVCNSLALFGEDAGVAKDSLRAMGALCAGSGADGMAGAQRADLWSVVRVLSVHQFDPDIARL